MTEHVHEWELGMEWSHFCDDPADFDGYILTCKYPDCDATIRESPWSADKPITARLNATERPSADDANLLFQQRRKTMSEIAGLEFLRRCVEQGRNPDIGDCGLILRDFTQLEAENAALRRVVDAIDGHDRELLLRHAKMLKQSDGEGWAIGEMVERALLTTKEPE